MSGDISLTKNAEQWRNLQPGDPWTFIMDEPVSVEHGSHLRPVMPGDFISREFAADEPERMFRVVSVTEPATYETIFVGFEIPTLEGAAE